MFISNLSRLEMFIQFVQVEIAIITPQVGGHALEGQVGLVQDQGGVHQDAAGAQKVHCCHQAQVGHLLTSDAVQVYV